jgi:hypothetical protein
MLLSIIDRQLIVQILSTSSGNPKTARAMRAFRDRLTPEPDAPPADEEVALTDRELLLMTMLFKSLADAGRITADLIPTYDKFMGVE